MLNVAQFSAAKSASEGKLLQSAVFDEDKAVKPFPQFRKDAKQITDVVQETWLRVERDTCVRNAVQGEVFRGFMADADLYPYWVWKGVMDDRERPSHVTMQDKVFRIGDPAGDACFPPGDWNCRCEGENADDDYLEENNLKVSTSTEAQALLETHIDPDFRYNPALQGPMPNNSSYTQVLSSANDASYKTFDLQNARDYGEGTNLTGLAAKGMHNMIVIMDEWRNSHHVRQNGDIVFQNRETLTNVRFANSSLHTIQDHSRGFENIPDTVTNPDEIWMRWENVEKQLDVIRNYIKFGHTSYIVQTRNGLITDAFAVSNGQCNSFRRGVIV